MKRERKKKETISSMTPCFPLSEISLWLLKGGISHIPKIESKKRNGFRFSLFPFFSFIIQTNTKKERETNCSLFQTKQKNWFKRKHRKNRPSNKTPAVTSGNEKRTFT